MTVKDALTRGISTLRGHACAGADAARDAELLLAAALRCTKEDIAMRPERVLSPWTRLRYARLLWRRAHHAPMAHLTGWIWFAGRRFRTGRHALIPRPATETVVEDALTAAPDATTIIDVGTGSGVIAVTCALARPDAHVIATDLSRRALRVARRNAALHGVTSRISFVRDDLIEKTRDLIDTAGPVLVIANLPYLPDGERSRLDPDVLRNEPAFALFGGSDGLEPSRRLIDRIAEWKARPPFTLALELLDGQCEGLISYTRKKIPGLEARTVLNASGVRIGVVLTAR